LLSAQAAAAVAYWDWVAAGLNVRIQQRLLDLGVERADQIERRIRAGDEAEFTRIDNERLIASRQIKLIESQRKFGQSAVTLSLYLRDLQGQPSLPAADLLSNDYPSVSPANIEPSSIIAAAIEQRPEVQVLAYDASVLRVQLAEAENLYLPELNVVLQGAQDVGGKPSSSGPKIRLRPRSKKSLSLAKQRYSRSSRQKRTLLWRRNHSASDGSPSKKGKLRSLCSTSTNKHSPTLRRHW